MGRIVQVGYSAHDWVQFYTPVLATSLPTVASPVCRCSKAAVPPRMEVFLVTSKSQGSQHYLTEAGRIIRGFVLK